MPIVNFRCVFCDKVSSRYRSPNSKLGPIPEYCSRLCYSESLKFKIKQDTFCIDTICEFCKKDFSYIRRKSKEYNKRFCSDSCRSKHKMLVGSSGWCSSEKKLQYFTKKLDDKDAAAIVVERHRQSHSKASSGKSNPRYGCALSEQTRKKISKGCAGIPNVLSGKTFIEFYGEEEAKRLGDEHSEKLREGFRTGRIQYTNFPKNAPTYKNVKLRSLLEYNAIEYLLSKNPLLVFNENLLYEPYITRSQYVDAEGKTHTYIPDLFDTMSNIVYEVKPSRRVYNESDIHRRKREAIQARGFEFRYLTEIDAPYSKRKKSQ